MGGGIVWEGCGSFIIQLTSYLAYLKPRLQPLPPKLGYGDACPNLSTQEVEAGQSEV